MVYDNYYKFDSRSYDGHKKSRTEDVTDSSYPRHLSRYSSFPLFILLASTLSTVYSSSSSDWAFLLCVDVAVLGTDVDVVTVDVAAGTDDICNSHY